MRNMKQADRTEVITSCVIFVLFGADSEQTV